MQTWNVALRGENWRCKHDWAMFWDAEPLERQCTKCLELQELVEDDLFLDLDTGYNERRGYESR